MNKRTITLFIILLAVIVVAIVARDMISRSPSRGTGNPYKLEMDSLLQVDPDLIKYKEFRQIKIGMESPSGITLSGEKIVVAGDEKLLIISLTGELLAEYNLDKRPSCLASAGDHLLCIAFGDHFGIYNDDGSLIIESEMHSSSSVFTAIAVRQEKVFIADAGNRRVLVYDMDGNFRDEIRGESGDGSSHGFIVPSPNFHLAHDPEGNLWVTNPGIHTLQQYDKEGNLEKSWSKSSPGIEGFSGCCNPAVFTFLPDGRFLTSEKGVVRIKVYSPDGEFESVVAAPDRFTEDGYAPDLAVSPDGNIIALDIDKKMLRFFNLK